MRSQDAARLETRARTNGAAQNGRLTARIIRESDGETHTVYRLNGRAFPSLDEVNAARGSP